MKYVLMCAMLALSLSGQAKMTDAETDALMTKISNASCEGNDSGGTAKFDPAKFSAGKAKKALRKQNQGCKGMRMSKNKQEAVEAFERFADVDGGSAFAACLNESLTKTDIKKLIEMVKDSSNVAVFSSEYNGNDEREACDFAHFDVYRASGQTVSIVRDDTD
jgi:hypothetical protein